jgi:hypothetical protein
VEYIAYPLSLLAAVGAIGIWKNLERRERAANKGRRRAGKRRRDVRTYIVLLVILVVTSTVSAYSVQTTTSKAAEQIHQPVFDTMEWMEGNISKNMTIATDHRISQILWANGYNATSDDMYLLWYSDDWTDAEHELRAENRDYERVSYVLIDDVMKNKSVNVNINESYRPINDTNYEKFRYQPFELVEEGTFMSKNGKHWSELYWVNWTYIENSH